MTAQPALSGAVAVVTGATRGLGAATAEFLARCGAAVGVCSRDSGQAAATAAQLADLYGVATTSAGVDVGDSRSVVQFSELIRDELGNARIVINNAAVLGPVGLLTGGSESAWSQAIDVNLKGPAYFVAAFRDQLAATAHGRVVNLSGGGVGGPSPMSRTSAYVSSKAGVAALTEVLAGELGDIGATVNAIAPGALPTTFLTGVLEAGTEAAGLDLYNDAAARSGVVPPELLEPFFALLAYVLDPDSQWLTGRVLSARWETPVLLERQRGLGLSKNMYRLRRVDDDLFKEVHQ